MDQHLGALNVLKERMSQTHAFGCALYKARYISHDKTGAVPQVYHAQMGIQGGKMVICNFRLCIAHNRQQGGLSNIGKSYQPHIRNHLKL